jgi:flagellin
MRINHNIAALNTSRQLNSASNAQSKSMEKLSSGLRINRAGDDAAGLAISEKMRGQIRGLDQGVRNAQDGISMIQTAEGALNETHDILQRMRELATQASNSTLQTEDRDAIGEEMLELRKEVDRIGNTTQFNGKNLLNGSLASAQDTTAANSLKVGSTVTSTDSAVISAINVGSAKANTTFTLSDQTGGKVRLTGSDGSQQDLTLSAVAANGESTLNFSELGVEIKLTSAAGASAANLATALGTAGNAVIKTGNGSSSATFAIGANAGQNMNVAFNDMRSSNLGGTTGSQDLGTLITNNQSVSDITKSQNLITQLDAAIVDVSKQRGIFGAAQNRLEHTINNLNTSSENLTASESRIRDVDMAKEMMTQTKNSILSQAAQAMLAQSNQMPQGVLQLLR